jgi:hypothetical protein
MSQTATLVRHEFSTLKERPMLNMIIERMLRKMEQTTGVSSDYARDIKRGSTTAFYKFMRFIPMARHRTAAPIEASCVAAIATVIQQDCGPCLQIVVSMGLQNGVDADTIKAAIRNDVETLGPALALVHRYATNIGQGNPAPEDEIQAIRDLWGQAGLVDIAFAVAASPVFPTLKKALGHAATCLPLDVDGERVIPHAFAA